MNPEHVEIVKQGKEAIDLWYRAHSGEYLDLSGADLAGAYLPRSNLSGADLSGAHLDRANLTNADLSRANLSGAHLAEAIPLATNLYRANLLQTDLTACRAIDAILIQANLSHANLTAVELTGANLSNANLSEADLWGCQLIETSLSGAELTGAKLYGTSRDDWEIAGIKCRYVYWDLGGRERSPKDRDLEPGEFERLYAQLPTIEYVFEHGMTPLDPLVMDRVVQAINEQHPQLNLTIESINARGIYPTIRFTLAQEEQKPLALEAVTQEYRETNAKLQGANEALSGVIDQMIRQGMSGPINIGTGSMVAIGGSSINVQEYIHHLEEIEQAIKDAPAETLGESVKREALDTVSEAFKDVARGKAKEAAEAITQLAVRVGPGLAANAFHFFQNLAG